MKTSQHKIGTRTLALTMSLLTLAASTNAFACGGDWYPEVEVDPRIHGVSEAEKSQALGNYVAAAGSVIRMMPHIAGLKADADPLVARAVRVLAVAIVRSNGTLSLQEEVPLHVQGHWLGKNASQRKENLAWSVGALRRELGSKKDDPALSTELGEALSRVEGGAVEAQVLLESLAARDLIGSPEGYQVLARLRRQGGDEVGEQVALKRCESMAGSSAACSSGRRAS